MGKGAIKRHCAEKEETDDWGSVGEMKERGKDETQWMECTFQGTGRPEGGSRENVGGKECVGKAARW